MNADALLDDICSVDPVRVAAALQAAHSRGDELIPKLVERFERVLAASREPGIESLPYVGFLYFLAAEFRAQAAHLLMVQLLRMPAKLVDQAVGDGLTEGVSTALADTCPGSIDALLGLIDDGAADPFARGAGLTALAMLWKRDALSREELLGQLLRVASLLNPESENDALVGNAVVDIAIKVNAHEIRSSILDLYERGLADEMYYESEYAGMHLLPGATPAHEEASLNRTIDDAWAELRHWDFFTEKSARPATAALRPEWEKLLVPRDLPENPLEPQHNGGRDGFDPPMPFRAPPKIGRNEPCPCGSGKKYKKCCGQ
jgi:hypothetical protein